MSSLHSPHIIYTYFVYVFVCVCLKPSFAHAHKHSIQTHNSTVKTSKPFNLYGLNQEAITILLRLLKIAISSSTPTNEICSRLKRNQKILFIQKETNLYPHLKMEVLKKIILSFSSINSKTKIKQKEKLILISILANEKRIYFW